MLKDGSEKRLVKELEWLRKLKEGKSKNSC